MGKRMHRAQILLEQEQHQALAAIARQEERSISEIVRQIIDQWLAAQEEDAVWRRRTQAMQALRVIREDVLQHYGVVGQDLLAEVREEREQDIERTLREGT